MGSNDDLFVRALEAVKQGGMVRRSGLTGTRKSAQVVDNLQDDQIANARLGKYVAIETPSATMEATPGGAITSTPATRYQCATLLASARSAADARSPCRR